MSSPATSPPFELRPGARARLERAHAFLSVHLDAGCKNLWVLAPSHLAGRRLLRALAVRRGRLAFVRPFTLRSLTRELALPGLVSEGLAALPPLGARALAATTLAHHASELPTLGRRLPEYEGLRRILADELLELRLHGVTPAELLEHTHHELASKREPELATLLSAFEETLTSTQHADDAELIRLALHRLDPGDSGPAALAPPSLAASTSPVLLVLDPAPASLLEAELLARLAGWASDALVLSAPGAEPFLTHLAAAGLSPTPPVARESTTALARAQQHLFGAHPAPAPGDPTLTVRSEPEASAEAAEIVRQIDALGRAGTGYDQIAVLIPDGTDYLAHFQEAFARAELPATLVPGPPVPEPAGRTLRTLLRVGLEGGSVARFLEALSLGELKTLTGGVSRARLERLLVDAGVVTGDADRWERRLAQQQAELRAARDEAARDPDSPALARIEDDLRCAARLRERAVPLVRRLCALTGVFAGWAEWTRRLRSLCDDELATSEPISPRLEELARLDGLGETNLQGVLDLLDQRLGLTIDPPGPDRGGRVSVLPLLAARGCSFEHVFVPGLVEGAFPAPLREDPLLFDDTRALLRGETFKARERDRLAERDQLRVALDAAGERLVFTFPRLEPSAGREPVPSSYLFEVLEAGEGWRGGLDGLRQRALDESGARLDHPVPLDATRCAAPVEYDLAVALAHKELRHLEGADPSAESGLDCLRRAATRAALLRDKRYTSADGLVDPPPALEDAISRRTPELVPVSASGLETFARCPYAFFLSRVVRLRELEEPEVLAELDPLTRGNLIHTTVQRFFLDLGLPTQLRSSELETLLPRLDAAFDAAARAVQEELATQRPLLLAGALADTRRHLQRWLRARAAEGDAGWKIVASELAFGRGPARPGELRDPASVDDPVTLPGKPSISLVGQIDLVEESTRGERRITDLKGGAHRVQADDRLMGGQSLQRPLYALAYAAIKGEALAQGSRPTTARLSYVGAEPIDVEIPVGPELLHDTSRALSAVTESFAAAAFPAAPGPRLDDWRTKARRVFPHDDAPPQCPSFCVYLPVCGKSAARRAKTKQYDSRLRRLRVIRGLQ